MVRRSCERSTKLICTSSVRFPDQCLTRVEALRGIVVFFSYSLDSRPTKLTVVGFTIDSAFASFSEKDLGSLEPGKVADYVVLSRDIMTIQAHEILDTKVLATVLDGQLAFGSI